MNIIKPTAIILTTIMLFAGCSKSKTTPSYPCANMIDISGLYGVSMNPLWEDIYNLNLDSDGDGINNCDDDDDDNDNISDVDEVRSGSDPFDDTSVPADT
ncbi:MAG: hypothetical protein GQ531_10565, partial [Sulfurovum sp.]|nr:hypothetical protein [Sulfurovum sp.]